MHLIEYIKSNGLDSLKEDLGIKIREYAGGLSVFNYYQINSPKTHPVVMECRGVALDEDLNIIRRPFDRFFNLGEAECSQPDIDWESSYVYEKPDGTLMILYYWQGDWHVGTRGTAFGENGVGTSGITFVGLFEKALGVGSPVEMQEACGELDKDFTYMFELTSPHNRVVTPYESTSITLIGKRHTQSGEYADINEEKGIEGVKIAKRYPLGSPEGVLEAAKSLPPMEEGYVVYNSLMQPVVKVKNPAYVALHRIRGNGIKNSPRSVAELVVLREDQEYLSYFPEDREIIDKAANAWIWLYKDAQSLYEKYKDVESQKEFALSVKVSPMSSVLFNARKEGKTFPEALGDMPLNFKVKVLLENWDIDKQE
ncbi:MAG TPA: RNA ligase [Tissierellaceae bacterium]|nr:RNA ligase [Tissierellaceae bacterium]